MKHPDLILFDWDRTLCDIEGPTNTILEETFKLHGNLAGYKAFLKVFRSPRNQGRKVKDRLIEILGEAQGTSYYDTFTQLKKDSLIKPAIFGGICEQLRRIRQVPNRVIGIVSNKAEKDIMEDGWGEISENFRFLLGGNRVPSSELKPSGKLIEIAIETIGSVNHVLMIGDACHDINALGNAHFAGKKIGVLSTWGISREEALIQREATHSQNVDTFQEVDSVENLSDTIYSLLNSH